MNLLFVRTNTLISNVLKCSSLYYLSYLLVLASLPQLVYHQIFFLKILMTLSLKTKIFSHGKFRYNYMSTYGNIYFVLCNRNLEENYILPLNIPRALKRSNGSFQERSLLNLIHRFLMNQPPPSLQPSLQVQSPLSVLSQPLLNPRAREGQKRQGSKDEPPTQSLELKEIRRNANAGRNRDFQTNGW